MKRYTRHFSESLLSTKVEFDTEIPSDEQILRTAIASELSTINLYQQFLNHTDNEELIKVLNSVIDEEKIHAGEFEHILYNHTFAGQDEKRLNDNGNIEAHKIITEKYR